MNIKICKLTSELVEDFIHFFDITPHNFNKDDKCYCVYWCNDDSEGKDFSSPEKRRDYAIKYVKNNNIKGYLAYYDNKVVGWCNANTKSDCLKCYHGRMYLGGVPTEESTLEIKIKSIFCFVIAPEMKRKGISKQFVERVCQDAAQDGFDFVEAYPNKSFMGEVEDYLGPVESYRKNGFTVYHEFEDDRYVMRKKLK
jgi:GNAT superfamily N-acetyltransferase